MQATALELGAAHPHRVPNELLLALLRDGARTKPAALTVAVLLCGRRRLRASQPLLERLLARAEPEPRAAAAISLLLLGWGIGLGRISGAAVAVLEEMVGVPLREALSRRARAGSGGARVCVRKVARAI